MSGDQPMQSPAATEFVGRQAELRQIEEVLATAGAPLLTLVGPGGIGKTRLTVEAMRCSATAASRTVHWARLARLAPDADTGTIAEEVVRSIAKNDVASRSAWDVLVSTFTGAAADRPPLRSVLVLDNCEHVLAGVGPLIVNLLDAIPNLTVVATSRTPIGWLDERILPVPPLPTAQALELFRNRAELSGQPIPGDAEHLAIAASICQHMDNNPLFIRLAAARLRHRAPAHVLRELTGDSEDKRLSWSHGAVLGVDDRHRGVHDAIAWSYNLCTEPEQRLVECLSMFAAGFEITGNETCHPGAELDAIIAVCGDLTGPADRIEQLLERLVEQSLVSVHFAPTHVQFYLLESVRVFARDQLRAYGDELEPQLLAAHRRYYRDKVIAGQAAWYGAGEQDWLKWVRCAMENILHSIETSLSDPAEAGIGLESAVALMSSRAPFVTGTNRTITRLTEQALQATRLGDAKPTDLQLAATAMLGWVALWQGRQAFTDRLLDECVAACLPAPGTPQNWRATAATDIGLPAQVEFTWGMELLLMDLDPAAVDVLARARLKYAAAGDPVGAKISEMYQALARTIFGEPDDALQLAKGYLDAAVAGGMPEEISRAELTWLVALTKHGDPDEAERVGRELVKRHLQLGDNWTSSMLVHYVMVALTRKLVAQVDAGTSNRAELTAAATRIALLRGGIDTLHHSQGFVIQEMRLVRAETAQAVQVATAVLGSDVYAATARRGAGLRPESDELQRFLLGALAMENLRESRAEPRATPSRWSELSPAEGEVAVLAAAGWPNSAIAARRGSSVRTVDAQVAAIRQKLMVATRSDIVWHVPGSLRETIRLESDRRPARTAARS
ncbi:AAA family ATPase [Nocardia sp. NPDC051832]|uniref:ATP-binding protein n=1 Tax=Nocardia sp. NPDC051832 TaxID=3155673 RepID=UPI0034399690